MLDFHPGDERQGRDKDAQVEKALSRFIEQDAGHPISAWAREDLGGMLFSRKETQEAHAIFLAGAEAFPNHPFFHGAGQRKPDFKMEHRGAGWGWLFEI